MERILWIVLLIDLVAVAAVLLTGVVIFIRGGETNRRYGNFLLFLRSGLGVVAALLLALLYFVHRANSGSH